jgi:hypothetical protein
MALVVGNTPAPLGHRPSRDVSLYRSLLADMRSTEDGQCARIGIKDRTQPDDGREITVPECLTTQWLTYALPLNLFANVDLTHLSVMFEVVFQGSAGATVEVHNVRYSLDSVPTPVPPPLPRPFKVYTDWGATGNHYVPSGWMGDYTDITMDENWTKNPHSGTTCIRVVYSAAALLGNRWAGVYWQDPVDNWGKTPGPTGYDLRPFSQLSFWVRGDVGGEQMEFRVGGISTASDGNPLPYGDSLKKPVSTGVITLTTSWQLETINLRGQDLSHIIGGFAWVSNPAENPHGAAFYLDDIEFT